MERMLELRESIEKPENVEEVPGDDADRATILTELACRSSLNAKAFTELADIDSALTRIRRGTYGICELTNQPIEQERLEASPTARFSVLAQQKVEKKRRHIRIGESY
jgi:RNA polymerase-binding transcription factor